MRVATEYVYAYKRSKRVGVPCRLCAEAWGRCFWLRRWLPSGATSEGRLSSIGDSS